MNLKYWVCYKKVGIGHHYQRIKNRRRSGHFQFHRHQLLPDKVDRLFIFRNRLLFRHFHPGLKVLE